MSDLEKQILKDVQKAVGVSIQANLTGYNSSFNKMVNEVVEGHSLKIKGIIEDNFTKVINSK